MLAYLFIFIIIVCLVILGCIYLLEIYPKHLATKSNIIKPTSNTVSAYTISTPTTKCISPTKQAPIVKKPTTSSPPTYKKPLIPSIIESDAPSWFNKGLYVSTRNINIALNIHYILDINYIIKSENYNTYVNITDINTVINYLNEFFSPLHINFYINEIVKENAPKNIGKYLYNNGKISNNNIETHIQMILDFFIKPENQDLFNCVNNNKHRTIAKFLLYTLINSRKIVDGINIYLIPFLWRDMFSVISNIDSPVIFLPEYNYDYNNVVTASFLKNLPGLAGSLAMNIGRIFGMTGSEFTNMNHLSTHRLQYIRYVAFNTIRPIDVKNKSVLLMTNKDTQYNDYMNIDINIKLRLLNNVNIDFQIKKNLELIDAYINNYFNTAFLRQDLIEGEVIEDCVQKKSFYDKLGYTFY